MVWDSAVFQAGGLVVVLVEVIKKPYLASIVPVVVNAILNDHQLVVDIVAFVARGDFPRSRLGEKQRGKILTAWVNRKMYLYRHPPSGVLLTPLSPQAHNRPICNPRQRHKRPLYADTQPRTFRHRHAPTQR